MKEAASLPDIQLTSDRRGLPLNQVGVSRLRAPLRLASPLLNGEIVVPAVWRLSVSLAKELRGTHMSRFVSAITEFGLKPLERLDLSPLLEDLQRRLQSADAEAAVSFCCFVNKTAPVTGLSAAMPVDCRLQGSRKCAQTSAAFLKVAVPVASACPCSRAISECGAHTQRAVIRAVVRLEAPNDCDFFWLSRLVTVLEQAGSSPVYPLLKRPDEKYVTDRQYKEAKFVEDIVREAVLGLRLHAGISGFHVEAEAYESIHPHNAWAAYCEGLSDVAGPIFPLGEEQ